MGLEGGEKPPLSLPVGGLLGKRLRLAPLQPHLGDAVLFKAAL